MNAVALPPDQVLRLGDGRKLAYIRWNPAGSHPLVFCHGTPGCRLFRPTDLAVLHRLDIDFVTIDRPGYGRSSPQPGRRLGDWAADVAFLADALRWGRFAVAGISGGGPHALACAALLPERVAIVGVISSLAPFWPGAFKGMQPFTRRAFRCARWAPWLLAWIAARAAADLPRFAAQLRRQLPESDVRILDRPEVAALLAENLPEAGRTAEVVRETMLLRAPWDFDPAAIRVPARLWHGEVDTTVPASHGRRLAAMLPDCRATFIPGAGHNFLFDRWDEVLAALVG